MQFSSFVEEGFPNPGITGEPGDFFNAAPADGAPFRDMSYVVRTDTPTPGSITRMLGFVGHRAGDGEGVYVATTVNGVAPTLTEIVDTNTPIPNQAGGVYASNFESFRSVSMSSLNDVGKIAFIGESSSFSQGGIPFQGIFTDRNGSVQNVVDTVNTFQAFLPGNATSSPFEFESFDAVNFENGALVFSGKHDGLKSVVVRERVDTSGGQPVILEGTFDVGIESGLAQFPVDVNGFIVTGTIVEASIGVNGIASGGGAAAVSAVADTSPGDQTPPEFDGLVSVQTTAAAGN